MFVISNVYTEAPSFSALWRYNCKLFLVIKFLLREKCANPWNRVWVPGTWASRKLTDAGLWTGFKLCEFGGLDAEKCVCQLLLVHQVITVSWCVVCMLPFVSLRVCVGMSVGICQSYVSRYMKGDIYDMSERSRHAILKWYLIYRKNPAAIGASLLALFRNRLFIYVTIRDHRRRTKK